MKKLIYPHKVTLKRSLHQTGDPWEETVPVFGKLEGRIQRGGVQVACSFYSKHVADFVSMLPLF